MAITESTYALVDVTTEVKPWLGIEPSDTRSHHALTRITNFSSAAIERELDRHLVTRGAITEYHTVNRITSVLYTRQFPIISLTSVHEDYNREYGSDDLLVSGTDFIESAPAGSPSKLTRVYSSTGGERAWLIGLRAIRVIYSAGYATTNDVEDGLKDIALRHIALVWREVSRGEQGVSSISDAMGNVSRFSSASLKPFKPELYPYRNFSSTGEVDS